MPQHTRNAARIVDLYKFAGLKAREDLGAIVATSGGYDPLHPGHVSSLLESSTHGDTLVVIVNGDDFLRRKKGKPFMDLRARCQVVSGIRGVNYVIPFEIEDDDTVCEALRVIRPRVFTKGGDRTDMSNIPEWSICAELGIEVISGVGMDKAWSSSDYLDSWGRFWTGQKGSR